MLRPLRFKLGTQILNHDYPMRREGSARERRKSAEIEFAAPNNAHFVLGDINLRFGLGATLRYYPHPAPHGAESCR